MQQRGADAYARTQQTTSHPRELEASLLNRAAVRLQAVKDDWSGKKGELEAALSFNRRLWVVFVTSVSRAENPLPREIKQNIANLGLFVFHHTVGIQADPNPAKLGALININRQIAEGLRAQP
jgi:flagellar protein FlaF